MAIGGLAFTVSFLYGFKHLLLLSERDWHVHDTIFFTSFEAWDVDHYLAQLKEVYEGNYLLSNAYLFEYKHAGRSVWPLFPNLFMKWGTKILRVNVQDLAVIMDFLFPPCLFLLTYTWLSALSTSRYKMLAALGAFLFVVTPHLSRIDVLAYLAFDLIQKGFLPPLLDKARCYYCFGRMTNPQLTYNFLLASLLCFSQGVMTSKTRYFVLSACFGIMLSYSYFYFSLYLYAVLCLVALGLWAFKEPVRFRKSVLTLLAIVGASLPFWFSLYRFFSRTSHQTTFQVLKNRAPLINASFINAHLREQLVLTLFLCIMIFYCIRKSFVRRIPGIVACALLMSGILCLEQHVLTGILIQSWHYDAFINPQMTIFVLTWFGIELIPVLASFQYPKRLFLYSGVGLLGLSVFSMPSFIASSFSADGALTPAFAAFLITIERMGVGFGASMIGGFLLWNRQSSQFRESMCVMFKKDWMVLVKKLSYGIAMTIAFIYVTWDVGLAQYTSYHQTLQPNYAYLQQLAPALNWLNEHTPKESVVLGSPDHTSTNSIIPIYTHNNIYVSFHSQFYTVPPLAEIHDRFYTSLYVMGIRTKEEFEAFAKKTWLSHGAFDYTVYQQRFGRDVYAELTKYRVEYIFYGPRERENFLIDPETAYSFLRKVYDDDVVKIYQVL